MDASQDAIPYLSEMGSVAFGSHTIEQNIIALWGDAPIFTLLDDNDAPVALPEHGQAVVGDSLLETYGLRIGDTVTVSIGDQRVALATQAVAANAKSASIYMNPSQMEAMMGLPAGSCNGALRSSVPANLPEGAEVLSREQRIDDLNRNAVSNNVSAIINQATGVLVGCILLFLALFVNFQDNTRDMLILHMMGYRIKAIRKLLINIYLPIVWVAFFATLAPSIFLAKAIQKSLSISTNDYMPFGTNAAVVVSALVIVTLLHQLVQMVFSIGVRRVIVKEEVSDVIYAE
jgi:putative ABC transport system permease protein